MKRTNTKAPARHALYVLVDRDFAKQVHDAAWARHLSVSEWVREIVERELKVKP